MDNDANRRAEFLVSMIDATNEYQRALRRLQQLAEIAQALGYEFQPQDFEDRKTMHISKRRVDDLLQSVKATVAFHRNGKHDLNFLRVETPNA